MARFDRYMLSQLMVLFGFFALILVSVFWINRAVRLFDTLIGDGQSAMVFLEFTALTLPRVIRVVLPLAAFAASVYVTNRLSSESELTVMQATGYSPWRLARPVLVFGIFVGCMMAILTHSLVPASRAQLTLREFEISRNITSKLLTDGTFLHPSEGMTFYVADITPEGALNNVYLSDRRRSDETHTYTANRAFLVRHDDGPKLVMFDGLVQNHIVETNQLFTTHFEDFTFDISALIPDRSINLDRVAFLPTAELASDPAAVSHRTGASTGLVMEELHQRFAQPLMCIVSALIGFSTLLTGTYSRFGVWRQIFAALMILVVIKMIEGLATDPVLENARLWPMIYLATFLGFAIVAGQLAWAGRVRRPGRARQPADEVAP